MRTRSRAPNSGWIVEHNLLVDRLWNALPAAGVRVLAPARAEAIEPHDEGVRVRLDDGVTLDARVLLAADGADSAVRAMAGFETDLHDYAQKGVVAYVASERPHEDTAWQRFLPTGPLALLPCTRGEHGEHVSSIVWTLPNAEAERMLALDAGGIRRRTDQRLRTSPRGAHAALEPRRIPAPPPTRERIREGPRAVARRRRPRRASARRARA